MKIVKFFSLYLVLSLLFFVPSVTHAQDNAIEKDSSVTVEQENLSNLIETLETKEERENFIQNLKTLQDVAERNEDPVLVPISNVLGLDKTISSFADSYAVFLEENNLSTSVLGKLSLTALTSLLFCVVAFFMRKGSMVLRRKLLGIKNKLSLSHDRFKLYCRILQYFTNIILVIFFTYTLAVIWNLAKFNAVINNLDSSVFGNILNIGFVVLIAITIWECINCSIEYGMHRATGPRGNRLRTLLPIVRNVVFVIFGVLFTLVLLSELGINILPLLAGAGIFGIAVGFGAQTMVKDFLTGFTIILEDLIQVGDVARLGGLTGVIEKITIRKVQLRDLDGTVYTVPFSEIKVVENLTKDYSYYLMDVGIAYREDPDEVIRYLEEIDKEMRSSDHYKDMILAPIEVLGVDKFADSAVLIKARIKTKPIKQWDVGREFNRRMKIKFDEKQIEIPFPHQTIYFGADKEGNAPPAPLEIKDLNNATEEKS